MNKFGSKKLTSKRLAVSAFAVLITFAALFSVIGIFQNVNSAMAKTAENTAAITADQSSNTKADSTTKNSDGIDTLSFKVKDESNLDKNEGITITFAWDSNLGRIETDTIFPKTYDASKIGVNKNENELELDDENGSLDSIIAHANNGCSFEGWFIGIRSIPDYKIFIEKDTTIWVNFVGEDVNLNFAIPQSQKDMGYLNIDAQMPVQSGQISVPYESSYTVNGASATIISQDGKSIHWVAAINRDNYIFTGWYDLDGNRITGTGVVRGTTTITARFSETVRVSGYTYTQSTLHQAVDANISYYDESGNLIASAKSDSLGYDIYLPINSKGRLVAMDSRDNPECLPDYKDPFEVTTYDEDNVNFYLRTPSENEALIYGYVYDADSFKENPNNPKPLVNADVRLAKLSQDGKQANEEPEYTTTDNYGMYYFVVDKTYNYCLGAVAAGYLWHFVDVKEIGTITYNPFPLENGRASAIFEADSDTYFELVAEGTDPDVNLHFTCDYTINLGAVADTSEFKVNGGTITLPRTTNAASPFSFSITAKSKSSKEFKNWKLNGINIADGTEKTIGEGSSVFNVNYDDTCSITGTVVDAEDTTFGLENINIYYADKAGTVLATSNTDSSGKFAISVEQKSEGTLYFADAHKIYQTTSFEVTAEITSGTTKDIGNVVMSQTEDPTKDKIVIISVFEAKSEGKPISNANVFLDFGSGQRMARTNLNGLVLFNDIPNNVNEVSAIVYAKGYYIKQDKISCELQTTAYIIRLEEAETDMCNLSFAFPDHVDKYRVTYTFDVDFELTYECEYLQSFDLFIYKEDSTYGKDGSKIEIKHQPVDANISFVVEAIPEDGYTVKDWDITTISPSNEAITGDTIFSPILEEGGVPEDAREFSLVGWDGHAGFTWTYFENEFPVDWGWDWAIDSYIYPYTYVWVGEDGSITATKHYEAEDWPYFGVAKTVVQTHPQEGYEFDYLTVNGQVVEKNSGFYVRDFDWGLFAVVHYKYSEQPDPPGPVPPGPVPPGPVPPGPVPPGPVPPDPPYPPDPPQPPVPPEPSPEPIYPEGGGTVIAPTSDYTWVIIAIIVAVIVLAGAGIGISQYLKRKKAKAAPKPPTRPTDGAKAAVGAAAAGAAATAEKPKAKDEKKIEIPKGEVKSAPKPADKPKEEKPKAEKPADKPKDDKPKHAK